MRWVFLSNKPRVEVAEELLEIFDLLEEGDQLVRWEVRIGELGPEGGFLFLEVAREEKVGGLFSRFSRIDGKVGGEGALEGELVGFRKGEEESLASSR